MTNRIMTTFKEQVKQQTYIIIIIIAKVSDVACMSVNYTHTIINILGVGFIWQARYEYKFYVISHLCILQ